MAILATDGFEQDELLRPKKALESAGATAVVVSPKSGKIKGWSHTEWGESVPVNVPLAEATPDQFDALMLPGGVMNPDHLRMDHRAVEFVRSFYDAGKPIAAICHGPWLLVESGIARGHRLTSYESIKTDLQNAGADWVDEPVVVDDGVVTSRKPDDIPAFSREMIQAFAQGPHQHRSLSEFASPAMAGRGVG